MGYTHTKGKNIKDSQGSIIFKIMNNIISNGLSSGSGHREISRKMLTIMKCLNFLEEMNLF